MGNTGKSIIALIVMSFCCFGQQTHRRFLIAPKSVQTAPFPPDIGYRWVATNLSETVTTWADAINGETWTAIGGREPHWTNGFGVHFTAGQGMQATNTRTLLQTNAWVAILKFDSQSATYNSIFSINNLVFYFSAYGKMWHVGTSDQVIFGTNTTGVLYDFIKTGANTTSFRYYTNGVLGVSTNQGLGNANLACIGWPQSGSSMVGSIYEFIVWTSRCDFTDAEIQTIHNYATNRWGGLP